MNNISAFLSLILMLAAGGCDSSGESDSTAAERRSDAQPAAALVVDASAGQLFGASRGSDWLTVVEASDYVSAGQDYQIYTLTDSLGTAAGGALQPASETCTNPGVAFEDLPAGHSDLLGISASWDPMPRTPSVQDTTQEIYRDRVVSQLSEHNIQAEDPPLDQVLRVDLEGDGVEEVLLVSNRLRGSATMAMAGDYAMVLLRKVIGDRVRQLALEAEYYAEECIGTCAPLRYRITHILDLNGDGVQEVVVAYDYFEGRGKRVYAVDGWKLRVVMDWRCGA